MFFDFSDFYGNKDKYFDDNCPKYLLKFVDSEFFDSTLSGYIHVQSVWSYVAPEDRKALSAAQADDGEMSIRLSFKDTTGPNELLFIAPLSDPSNRHLVIPTIDPVTGCYTYNFTMHETYRFPAIQTDLENTLIGSYYGLDANDVVIQGESISLTDECKSNLFKSQLNTTANGDDRSYVIYDCRLFFNAIIDNIIDYPALMSAAGFRLSMGMISYYDNFDNDRVSTYLNKIDELSQSNNEDKRLQAMMYLINNKQKKYESQREFRLSIAVDNSDSQLTIKTITSFFSATKVENDIKESIIYQASALV